MCLILIKLDSFAKLLPFKMFPICSAAFHILLYSSIGDFGLPSRALLSAPRGGHVGRPVAEEVQVSRDSHCHRLRAAWLLRTGERELDVHRPADKSFLCGSVI